MGEEDLFRKVLWSKSHLCCLEIGSSVYRSAAAARSTLKFSRVGLANTNQQPWYYLCGFLLFQAPRSRAGLACFPLSSGSTFRFSFTKPEVCPPPSGLFCFLSTLSFIHKLSKCIANSAIFSDRRELSGFPLKLFQNSTHENYEAKPKHCNFPEP